MIEIATTIQAIDAYNYAITELYVMLKEIENGNEQ
jgi:hypothetical protein